LLTYSATHRIEWGECDSARIVYYPNFYRWFDQGSHELFRKAGYSVKDMRDQDRDILLVETGCTYRAPGHYDDVVQVNTSVTEARGKIVRLSHDCRRGDELLCEGYEVRAYADISTIGAFKAVAMPDDMIAALTA
jgi:4-hydroxybenzoyl-CoA thioesterase